MALILGTMDNSLPNNISRFSFSHTHLEEGRQVANLEDEKIKGDLVRVKNGDQEIC